MTSISNSLNAARIRYAIFSRSREFPHLPLPRVALEKRSLSQRMTLSTAVNGIAAWNSSSTARPSETPPRRTPSQISSHLSAPVSFPRLVERFERLLFEQARLEFLQ